MTRVLLVITNPQQAAYRLRWGAILPALAERGIHIDPQVRPKSLLGRWRLARSASKYDAVVIQRKLLDPSGARAYRRHTPPGRLLFDVDDAVMFRPESGSGFSQWRQQRRLRATARALDLAVVGNDYLEQQFEQQGVRCEFLPTTVDPAHYLIKQHAPTDVLRLVWIGSRSTLRYLQQHLPAIERAHNNPYSLELITIADATVESRVLPIRHIPWAESTEAASLVQGDLGVAPTPDDAWARGKCGFKIIQYMASALPVIASPVGANCTIVRDGVNGFLPADEQGWIHSIAQLGSDPSLRTRMGMAGRKTVEEHYAIDRAVEFWEKLLRKSGE